MLHLDDCNIPDCLGCAAGPVILPEITPLESLYEAIASESSQLPHARQLTVALYEHALTMQDSLPKAIAYLRLGIFLPFADHLKQAITLLNNFCSSDDQTVALDASFALGKSYLELFKLDATACAISEFHSSYFNAFKLLSSAKDSTKKFEKQAISKVEDICEYVELLQDPSIGVPVLTFAAELLKSLSSSNQQLPLLTANVNYLLSNAQQDLSFLNSNIGLLLGMEKSPQVLFLLAKSYLSKTSMAASDDDALEAYDAAVECIQDGLKLDPQHHGLLQEWDILQQEEEDD